MAAVPGRLPLAEPMLASPVRDVPADEGNWAAETKWDGARFLAYLSGGTAVLRGRSGQDVTSSYPEVAAALARAAGRRTLILDGELTAFGEDRPSFALLQRRLHVTRPAPALVAAVPVTFIAFDLLHQAGKPLPTAQPLCPAPRSARRPAPGRGTPQRPACLPRTGPRPH
jgi:bifunctional non-homologous end joining protein LigD